MPSFRSYAPAVTIMDNGEDTRRPDLRQLTKSKIMGKFFGKSRDKEQDLDERPTNDAEVSDFLHGPSDKLFMTGAPPPAPVAQLTRIDTTKAPRWPSAEAVRSARTTPVKAPRRNRKGLRVQFTNRWPEIIGYGGEDFEEPTLFVSQAKEEALRRAHQNVPQQQHMQGRPQPPNGPPPEDFTPMPIRRTQTGHVSIPELSNPHIPLPRRPLMQVDPPSTDDVSESGLLKANPTNPNSFAARVKAEMRSSEGKALIEATRASHLEELGRESSESLISSHSNVPSSAPSRTTSTAATSGGNLAPLMQTPSGPPSPGRLQPLPSPGMPSPSGSSSGTFAPQQQRARSNSGQSMATIANDQALEEFAYRVQNSFKLFVLSAESVKPLSQTTLEELVRIASWWFLRGRANIEAAARERPSNGNNMNQMRNGLGKEQGHADLAKAFWIIAEVIPQSKEIGGLRISDMLAAARDDRDMEFVDLLERFQAIQSHLGKLANSMKRNNFLPPTPDEAPLSSGIDNSIWLPAPPIPTDVYPILRSKGSSDHGGRDPRTSLAITMPLGDTPQVFNYFRLAVNVFVMGEGFRPQQDPAECIMAVSRRCDENQLCIYLTNQTGVIDLCIQSDRNAGSTWKDVKWLGSQSAIDLKLPRGFVARILMAPQDFLKLWNLYDHLSRTSSILHPQKDEELLFDKVLKSFQYFDDDPQSRQTFPRDPVESCYVRLLERKSTQVSGTGARSTHCGYRLAVMTGPRSKHLNGISREIVTQQPLRYEFLRGPTGDPTLSLNFKEGDGKARMALTFSNDHDRGKLHHLLIGGPAAHEAAITTIPLVSFTAKTVAGSSISGALQPLLANSTLQVLNKGVEGQTDPESTKTIRSESLRLLIHAPHATVTDRLNISSGEILLRLPATANDLTITLHRTPQSDLTVALADLHIAPETSSFVLDFITNVNRTPTLRTFQFQSLTDLHAFQAAITGFKVLHDSFASSFAISRRRMVVPIYKKWDSGPCRIQIVRQEKVMQFVAWFEGWSKGECVNFVLKGTDNFETFGKDKAWGVRLVDAKFALPKGGEKSPTSTEQSDIMNTWSGGVSLDEPDYPGEHDDITIMFESENERDAFAGVLPAPVKAASRLGTISRR